jgi:hypothetical protein
MGASVIVGDQDVRGIDLNAMPLTLVPDIVLAEGPRPAGGLAPGTIAPTASGGAALPKVNYIRTVSTGSDAGVFRRIS